MTLLDLGHLLRKHLRFVIIVPIVCALVVGLYSILFMRDQYTATSSMFVLAQTESSNNSSNSLSSDLSASQMLSNDVANLLRSDRVKNQAGNDVGVPGLAGYSISVSSQTTSRIITLSVTGPNAQTAADINNAMMNDVSDIAQSVMDVQPVNPVEQAQAPSSPSGPNRLLYVLIAFAVGLFAAVVIVVIADMVNTKVRSADELESLLDGVPVIGRIPEI